MTSDELLEGTDHLYRSIVIIGGGVIGVEFATFTAIWGAASPLLEGMDRLLPNMDRGAGSESGADPEKAGGAGLYPLHGGSSGADAGGHCRPLHPKGDPRLRRGGGGAVRHRPQGLPDGLFAEGLTPETNGHGLWVDEHYQTSIPGVYAIGDVPGAAGPCGGSTGAACVEHMAGLSAGVCMDAVPSCIYCRPEIAAVG